ncbi:hypothetical protein [Rodentibacter caecimuris]|uniref:hypothetical protein n=1 Tax=Rodentibacter caecimuris TaxID=1796644 RepID=UPI000987B3DC|nr:hypothetical protein BKG97_06680 [Rodentibacter heylii]
MGAKIWFAIVIFLVGSIGYIIYDKVQKGRKIDWYILTLSLIFERFPNYGLPIALTLAGDLLILAREGEILFLTSKYSVMMTESFSLI